LASTPTVDDGAETIFHHLKQSTYKTYRVPCLQCNELAEIGFAKGEEKFSVQWDKVITDGDLDINATASSARLVCPYCDYEINDTNSKNRMVSHDMAKWISTNPLADESHQGYHLNSLYSSYISIKDACRMFLEAKGTNELQDYRNSFQALPWKHETEDTPDIIKMKELETEYSRGELPPDSIILLTCDVQKYEFYWMVTAHDPDGVCHIVDNGRADNFDDLNDLYKRYKCDFAGVDSNYQTPFVLSNISRLGSTWFAIRGMQKMQGQLNIVPINPTDGNKDKAIQGTVTRFDVNNSHFKRLLVQMRNQKLHGLGIYRNADALLYRHLLAEVEIEIRDRSGRRQYEFKQVDRENHWFDCLNYALAMGHFFRKSKSAKVNRPIDYRKKPISESHTPEEM
jgi:hypothetical protein